MEDTGAGTYYRVLGAVVLLATLAFTGFQIFQGHSFTLIDLFILAMLFIVCLALIRPSKFDSALRIIIERIPGIPNIKERE
ncbi:MAG: hypothetical protein COW67_03035 [Flavobacteriales bacterium CG18_big_fil_WC_8_21_14_2_50_32_9]|nr:MAG: hypothetical protein COW67_03035 [Flavobacteriales bacterium CG18_big_fil_WC_8_21_14_2_50_32_9]